MESKKLSVVIPCFNERDHITTLIERVLASPIEDKEIIVVDDCSTDGTSDILREAISPLVSRILFLEQNSGKGAALQAGFAATTGDVVIVQDADLEYNPAEYPAVVSPIFSGEADVVYGSRFLKGGFLRKGRLKNVLANRFLTALSNLFTGLSLTDMETCYKAFRRDVIQSIRLEENRFGFEPEVTAKIAKAGYRIMEVPISYSPRNTRQGKKIGFKDGLRAIYCVWKYRAS